MINYKYHILSIVYIKNKSTIFNKNEKYYDYVEKYRV